MLSGCWFLCGVQKRETQRLLTVVMLGESGFRADEHDLCLVAVEFEEVHAHPALDVLKAADEGGEWWVWWRGRAVFISIAVEVNFVA